MRDGNVTARDLSTGRRIGTAFTQVYFLKRIKV